MKNQYLADINDYRKYGILRILAGVGKFRIGIVWMLTPDDDRNDGRRRRYLDQPEMRRFDENLYTALKALSGSPKKTAQRFAALGLIPRARYFDHVLTSSNRARYFKEAKLSLANSDLLFLDPDNGLSVKSIPRNAKESIRYVFDDEIRALWLSRKSLLIYQHFPRVTRERFVEQVLQRLHSLAKTEAVALMAGNVVYFLLFQPRHRRAGFAAVKEINEKWKGEIHTMNSPDR